MKAPTTTLPLVAVSTIVVAAAIGVAALTSGILADSRTTRDEPHRSTAALDSLARVLYFDARYDEAAAAFSRLAEDYRSRSEWRPFVTSRMREGESLRAAGDYQRGLDVLNAADSVRLARIGEDRHLEIRLRRQRGIVLIRLSRLDEAVEELSNALKRASPSTDPVLRGEVLQSLGWAYQEINDADRAFSLFQESLGALRSASGPALDQFARVFNSIGIHYYGQHVPDSAITYYSKAAQLRSELYGENHPLYATSIANLALAHHQGGDRTRTIPYYAKATEIFASQLGANHPEVARCYTNLGLFYWEDGKLGLAQLALDRSLEMRKRLLGNDHISLSYTYQLLANVALDKGDYDRAARYSHDVLRIARVNTATPTGAAADAMIALAQALEHLGQHARADSAYSRSLEMLQESGNESNVSRASANFLRARNLVRWGHSAHALDIIKGSCTKLTGVLTFERNTFRDCRILTAEILVELDSLGRASTVLQDVMAELGQADANLPVQRLRSIADGWRIDARIHRAHYERSQNVADLTLVMRSLERSQAAASILQERYFGKESKRAVLRATARVADSLIVTGISLHERLDDQAYVEAAFRAAEWRRTAILVDALHGLKVDGRAWIPRDVAEREAALRSTIVKQSAASLSLVELAHQHESILREIEQSYPKYSNLLDAVRPSPASDILQSIRHDEVVLEFAILGQDTYTFLLTSDSITVGKRLSSDVVTVLASKLRSAIKSHDYHAFVATARELYKLLIEPIERQIEGKQLIVVPDGVLQFVPFEALLTADVPTTGDMRSYRTLPYLIRRLPIAYSYSATLVKALRTRQTVQPPRDFLGLAPVFSSRSRNPKGKALLVKNADPDGGPLRSIHLPASLQEVKTIRRMFARNRRKRTTLLLHDDANERALKTLNLADYRFIHLATHAFANESDPDLSGLVLARAGDGDNDGVLHVREIYELDLNADLVVLSACETGLGRIATGEGIIGLTSGFLYAGAANVMVSLWKADDATTRDLMTSFYRVMLDGHSKAEALRQAKLELIARSPVHARPFYWAQFVVIGESR